jgi:hypothetical protein
MCWRADNAQGREWSPMGQGSPPRRTLASLLEDRDRTRFTGRAAEIAFLDTCLETTDSPASLVHICGPGGIGKSTILREVARRARERGRTVVALDGRELGPQLAELELAVRALASDVDPVLLLDSCELVTGLDPFLRGELLPTLPERSLVIMARRGVPDPGWFSGGWESLTAQLDLPALSSDEARKLLAAYGVADVRVPSIIEWAAGSPLALALAADAAVADSDWDAARSPDRSEILRSLLHRLVDTELHHIRPSALGIAVVARTTTLDLLRAMLPDEDAETAYQQLAGLTVTEPLGGGIVMHELVRRALLADLRLNNADLERQLRRRIADYLCARAAGGEPQLVIDIAHLVENPLVRWGFGWDGNAGVRLDAVRPDDAARAELVPSRTMPSRNEPWWLLSRRYFTDAPGRVSIARDDAGEICGYMVCMSLATAPEFAYTDPLTGPWLAQARRDEALGDSVLWQAAVDLTGEGKVQAILGVAGTLRSGAANPRFAYLPIDERVPGALDFARATGASHLADLDAPIGDALVQCWRLDYGPGGLFTLLHTVIHRELGLPRPADRLAEPAIRSSAPSAIDLPAVREALRNFHVPTELARGPLARGDSVAERADFVRRLLRTAADETFGASQTERLLHSVLVAGYFEPQSSHEAAAVRLNISRAAYFRRLRTAVGRLAEHLAAEVGA